MAASRPTSTPNMPLPIILAPSITQTCWCYISIKVKGGGWPGSPRRLFTQQQKVDQALVEHSAFCNSP